MSDFTDSYENASSNFCPGIVPGVPCGDDREEGSQYCHDCNKSIQKLAKKSMKNIQLQEKKTQKQEKEQEKEKAKKELEQKIKLSRESGDEKFKIYKEEFEKKYLMVSGTFLQIENDGTIIKVGNTEMKNEMDNKIIRTIDENGKEKKEKFLTRWLEDEKRICYDAIKFYPTGYKGELSEYKHYNLWNDFKIVKDLEKKLKNMSSEMTKEMMKEAEANNYTQEEVDKRAKEITDYVQEKCKEKFNKEFIEEKIKPILTHLDFITGGHKEFILKWLAKIIQTPGQKTEVALLIRDIGSYFQDCGGIGKNLFIDFFGKKILGDRYYHVISENKELYEDFNTSYRGKLLIFVEEASGKQNVENKDALKSKITKKDISIQGKGKDRYTCADFCNYIFTTNNANPLAIDKRRFAVFDSKTDKRGDEAYFTELCKKLDDFDVCYSFYLYLNNLDTWESPIQIQNAIPETVARRELIRYSTPVFVKWLSDFTTLTFLETQHTATATYEHFCNWFRNSNEGSEAHIMKKTDFFNRLTKEDKIFIKTKNCNIYYKADLPYIISELVKQYLLPSGYTLETAKLEKEINSESRKEILSESRQ